ncbi:flagellar biosynthesis protein FlhB [Propylenella binzhouense]|uniref:Flagellar biosynthetic protein FlhB n=1 Tax=Propylenella binzhouense TaxID=2555902 RepID=A0A964WSH8_9HYPH|nr:flagellar biosynthesis protein FlhB [Propylenella binzhouense]
MADTPEKDSKTEEPTERKIRDSIEKGRVPISREAAVFASFSAILIVFGFLINQHAGRLALVLSRLLDDPAGWSLDNGMDAILLWQAVFREALRFLVPIVVLLAVAGIAAAVLQNAPRLVLERIKPDWSRLSPGKGFARIFGLSGQVEFAKSVFKFVAITGVVALLLRSETAGMFNAMLIDPNTIPQLILDMSIRLLSAVCVATILLVSADLVWAQLQWRRDLRMTRQEVKDEFREMEGDPLVKARLRSLSLDRNRKRMMAAVPQATLVIANPTHFAVALRYVREEGGAPVVLAKGQDLIALTIRRIAEENGIPVVEDKALARSLYDSVAIDQAIPPDFYRAVAEVIYFLYAKTAARPPAR